MSKKAHRLVHVDWMDSHSTDGWKPFEQMSTDAVPAECRSVGWLIGETREAVMLVSSVIDQSRVYPAGTGTMTIPKKCIRRMKTIGRYELRHTS